VTRERREEIPVLGTRDQREKRSDLTPFPAMMRLVVLHC
jgi:hypothetical protein